MQGSESVKPNREPGEPRERLSKELMLMRSLESGLHSRELLQTQRFALAVQRELWVQMSKNSETGGPPLTPRADISAAETVDTLEALIVELLPEGRPTIERVAPKLGMSVRTLQRRLGDLRRSFEDIVDDTRRNTAIEYLTADSNSITDTAFRLGYSDLSHFTRAFRRWTAMSPREFVRTRRQSDGSS